MRDLTRILPLLLVLAACAPPAPPTPVAAPAPPVQAEPEAVPAAAESPVAAAPATTGATAAEGRPPAGSYGFNWLDPESPCVQLTEQDLAKASECTASNNAFGLELASHACRVDDKVEFIVYQTAAQCQEAHETMQANGD